LTAYKSIEGQADRKMDQMCIRYKDTTHTDKKGKAYRQKKKRGVKVFKKNDFPKIYISQGKTLTSGIGKIFKN
jgi:hypothetical protein